MCDTRTCDFCRANNLRTKLTDGTYAHAFENPEKGIAWCEPCADSKRYESQETRSDPRGWFSDDSFGEDEGSLYNSRK